MNHLPDGWTPVEEPEHTAGKYYPQQSALYERPDHEITVQVMATTPQTQAQTEHMAGHG